MSRSSRLQHQKRNLLNLLLKLHHQNRRQPKAPDISIREAVKTGNIEAVKQHLDAGADVNAKGKYGRTPLHYAASRGLNKIIELLIARGADVNTKIEVGDYKGQTPLDGAIQWNQTETADLLRKHGGKTGEELKAEGK